MSTFLLGLSSFGLCVGTANTTSATVNDRQQKLMSLVAVGEAWGIGRKLSERPNALRIQTALQLNQLLPCIHPQGKKAENYEAMLHFACAIIIWNKILLR